MIWLNDVAIEIVNYSNYHIHMRITNLGNGEGCFWIDFYGQLDMGRKGDYWRLLNRISSEIYQPWYVLEDFNEITTQDERLGKCFCPLRQIKDFKLALESSGLIDVGWRNQKFIWSNKHHDDTFTKERLDRVVVNK